MEWGSRDAAQPDLHSQSFSWPQLLVVSLSAPVTAGHHTSLGRAVECMGCVNSMAHTSTNLVCVAYHTVIHVDIQAIQGMVDGHGSMARGGAATACAGLLFLMMHNLLSLDSGATEPGGVCLCSIKHLAVQ